MKRRALWAALMLALIVGVQATAQVREDPKFGRPQIDAVTSPAKILDDAKIDEWRRSRLLGDGYSVTTGGA